VAARCTVLDVDVLVEVVEDAIEQASELETSIWTPARLTAEEPGLIVEKATTVLIEIVDPIHGWPASQ
jgi:hypothetical protein